MLWRVLIDDTARMEDCVKRSPCVYRVDITDKPPLIVALASVDRLLVSSCPLTKVEFAVNKSVTLMFAVLIKGAKIEEALTTVVLTRGVKIVEEALTKVVLSVLPT